MLFPKKDPDAEFMEALRRLRHAAFALAGSAGSVIAEDRDMAEVYLKEAARYFTEAEAKAGRNPK